MKRTFFYAFAAAAALSLTFGSCKKDKADDAKALTVSETVDFLNAGDANGIASVKAVAWNSDGDEVVIATGTLSGGKLTITLPAPLSPDLLWPWGGDGTLSDRNVKGSDTNLFAYDASGNELGLFNLSDESRNVYGTYFYVDRDVTLSGVGNSDTYNCSLKKGWNLIYETYGESSTSVTTAKPSGVTLKWWFDKW